MLKVRNSDTRPNEPNSEYPTKLPYLINIKLRVGIAVVKSMCPRFPNAVDYEHAGSPRGMHPPLLGNMPEKGEL